MKPDPAEWPDWPFVMQVYPAHEEGGERQWEVMVTAFEGARKVEGVRLAEARRTPERLASQVPGTEFSMAAELVLLAIGFEGTVRDRLLTELGVEFDNPNARRLYERLGFVEVGQDEREFRLRWSGREM